MCFTNNKQQVDKLLTITCWKVVRYNIRYGYKSQYTNTPIKRDCMYKPTGKKQCHTPLKDGQVAASGIYVYLSKKEAYLEASSENYYTVTFPSTNNVKYVVLRCRANLKDLLGVSVDGVTGLFKKIYVE